MTIRLKVECYSGHKADQRPVRFTIGTRTLEVETIVDQWYTPSEMYFRVLANDRNTYILRHDEGQDVWSVQVFSAKTK